MEESRDEEHHSLCIEARPFHLLYQRIVNVSEKEDNAVIQRETEKWRRKEGRVEERGRIDNAKRSGRGRKENYDAPRCPSMNGYVPCLPKPANILRIPNIREEQMVNTCMTKHTLIRINTLTHTHMNARTNTHMYSHLLPL